MSEKLPLPAWPNGAAVSVSLSFDFDADSGAGWRGLGDKLTTLSGYRFGATRGIHRILDLLDRHEITSTFYVPGDVIESWPHEVLAIAERGHEVAHHGYAHQLSDRISAAAQREELERGIVAHEELLGRRPIGYRSPGWELTPETFGLLCEAGFRYDSSCMGDDRPYVEEHGEHRILELPVHWSLDDWPFYGFSRERGGNVVGPDAPLAVWLEEFESALDERRHVTYTWHPEISGRGYRARVLERLIEAMRSRAEVWFSTHAQVAQLYEL